MSSLSRGVFSPSSPVECLLAATTAAAPTATAVDGAIGDGSRCLHRLCTKKAGHETAATACFYHLPASPVSQVVPVSPAPSLPTQTSREGFHQSHLSVFQKGLCPTQGTRRRLTERGSHSALLLSLKGLRFRRGPEKQTSPSYSKPYQVHTCSYTYTHNMRAPWLGS